MQHAQPILALPFPTRTCRSIFTRRPKLRLAAEGANVLPMGSGALAGNSLGIDRRAIAKELGFTRITATAWMQ